MRKNKLSRGGRLGIALTAFMVLTISADAWALLQSCNVSATAVNFGVYNPLSGTPDDATGTVSVSCDVILLGLLESWTITLSTGSSGSYASRKLHSGASVLTYNLYTNAARTTIWGDGTGGTSIVSDSQALVIGSNTSNYTAYGRVAAGQDQAAGTYTDVITVTLIY